MATASQLQLISPSRKISFVVAGPLLIFGVVAVSLGWISMTLILKREGNFEDDCSQKDLDSDEGCQSQQQALSLIFAIGINFMMLGEFVGGNSADRFGPKVTSVVGIIHSILGFIIFGAAPKSDFPMLVIGLAFISFAGPFVMQSTLNLAMAFPFPPKVITLFGNFFSSGTLIFFIFNVFSELGGVEKSTLCLSYAVICCGYAAVAFFIYPRKKLLAQQYSPPEQNDEKELEDVSGREQVENGRESETVTAAVDSKDVNSQLAALENQKTANADDVDCVAREESGSLEDDVKNKKVVLPMKTIIKTPLFFWGYLVYGSINNSKMIFLVSIFNTIAETNGDDGTLQFVAGLIIPMSFVFTKFMTYVDSRFGVVKGMCFNLVGHVIMWATIMIPHHQVQYITIILYTLCGAWIYTHLFTFAFRINQENMGRIHALGQLLTVAISFVCQIVFNVLTFNVFKGNLQLLGLVMMLVTACTFIAPYKISKLGLNL